MTPLFAEVTKDPDPVSETPYRRPFWKKKRGFVTTANKQPNYVYQITEPIDGIGYIVKVHCLSQGRVEVEKTLHGSSSSEKI